MILLRLEGNDEEVKNQYYGFKNQTNRFKFELQNLKMNQS